MTRTQPSPPCIAIIHLKNPSAGLGRFPLNPKPPAALKQNTTFTLHAGRTVAVRINDNLVGLVSQGEPLPPGGWPDIEPKWMLGRR